MLKDFGLCYTKKIIFVILIFVVSVLPIIVRVYMVPLPHVIRDFWGTLFNVNFFSLYKMVWLLLMATGLLFAFLAYAIKYKLIKTFYYLPLIIYAAMTVLSSSLSDYTEAVLLGFPHRYENVFIILAYLFLSFAAINIFTEKRISRAVVKALSISALVLCIHGLLQYFGFDFFLTNIGKRLIASTELEVYVNQFTMSFLGDGVIYSTFGNPNYVGSYGAMVLSLFLGLYITVRQKRKLYFLGLLNLLLFAYLVGSRSRAGMIGFLAGVILLVLVLHQQIRKNWRQVLVIAVAFLVIFLSMGVYSVEDLLGDIISPQPEEVLIEEEIIAPPITNVESEDNKLILETSDNRLNVILDNNLVQFLNEDGNYINHFSPPLTDRYYLAAKDYEHHSFKFNPKEAKISWFYYNKEAHFKYNDGDFFLQGMNREYFAIQDVPSWGFSGYERLGSSRGYIWSRTFPLLRETLLTGHGPDTYAFYFPQEDVVGKLRFLRSPRIMVDKPHNLYLQMAVNTGVLSLLAMLALWGYYLLQSLLLYWKADFNDWEWRAGAALMAAVFAYLVTGIFNDSVVSVAPVFWVLLGMGISINILLTRGIENQHLDL